MTMQQWASRATKQTGKKNIMFEENQFKCDLYEDLSISSFDVPPSNRQTLPQSRVSPNISLSPTPSHTAKSCMRMCPPRPFPLPHPLHLAINPKTTQIITTSPPFPKTICHFHTESGNRIDNPLPQKRMARSIQRKESSKKVERRKKKK